MKFSELVWGSQILSKPIVDKKGVVWDVFRRKDGFYSTWPHTRTDRLYKVGLAELACFLHECCPYPGGNDEAQ